MSVCPECHQKIKQAYKEMLDKHVLTMLKHSAELVIKTKVNEVRRTDVCESKTDYVNFSRLRFFGLLAKCTDKRGSWLITRNGWAFLRGEIKLSKWVLIRENHIVEHSTERLTVRDVYHGSEAIQTTFEYFDDYGQPVGFRPVRQQSRQLTLI